MEILTNEFFPPPVTMRSFRIGDHYQEFWEGSVGFHLLELIEAQQKRIAELEADHEIGGHDD